MLSNMYTSNVIINNGMTNRMQQPQQHLYQPQPPSPYTAYHHLSLTSPFPSILPTNPSGGPLYPTFNSYSYASHSHPHTHTHVHGHISSVGPSYHSPILSQSTLLTSASSASPPTNSNSVPVANPNSNSNSPYQHRHIQMTPPTATNTNPPTSTSVNMNMLPSSFMPKSHPTSVLHSPLHSHYHATPLTLTPPSQLNSITNATTTTNSTNSAHVNGISPTLRSHHLPIAITTSTTSTLLSNNHPTSVGTSVLADVIARELEDQVASASGSISAPVSASASAPSTLSPSLRAAVSEQLRSTRSTGQLMEAHSCASNGPNSDMEDVDPDGDGTGEGEGEGDDGEGDGVDDDDSSAAAAALLAPTPKKGSACIICYRAKTSCDGHRPCSRCVRLEKCELCVDRPKDERHPRKRKGKGLAQGERGARGRKRRYRRQTKQESLTCDGGGEDHTNGGGREGATHESDTATSCSNSPRSRSYAAVERYRPLMDKLKTLLLDAGASGSVGDLSHDRVAWFMTHIMDLVEPHEYDRLVEELPSIGLQLTEPYTQTATVSDASAPLSPSTSSSSSSSTTVRLGGNIFRRGTIVSHYDSSPFNCIETDHPELCRRSTTMVDVAAAASVGGTIPKLAEETTVPVLMVKQLRTAIQSTSSSGESESSSSTPSTSTADAPKHQVGCPCAKSATAPVASLSKLAPTNDKEADEDMAEAEIKNETTTPLEPSVSASASVSESVPAEEALPIKTEQDHAPPPSTTPMDVISVTTDGAVLPAVPSSSSSDLPPPVSQPNSPTMSHPPPVTSTVADATPSSPQASAAASVSAPTPASVDSIATDSTHAISDPSLSSSANESAPSPPELQPEPEPEPVCNCEPIVARTTCIQANREFERLFGYNQRELRHNFLVDGGHMFARMLRPDSRAVAVRSALEALVEGATEYRYYGVIVNKWLAEIHCLILVRSGTLKDGNEIVVASEPTPSPPSFTTSSTTASDSSATTAAGVSSHPSPGLSTIYTFMPLSDPRPPPLVKIE